MPRVRAIITITGEVQEAGYRAYVLKIARKLSLVGEVENIPDGTVKITCEGEKENIEKLVKAIKIKTETIEVEDIKVSYENATGEFDAKGFIAKISDLGQELFQGYVTAEKYFRIGWDKQDKMLEKQDKTLHAIEHMHQDTNRNFSIMARRYDLIAKNLAKGLAKIDEGFARVGKEFVKSRKETAQEFSRSRKESANAYNKLAKAVDDIGKILKAQLKKK